MQVHEELIERAPSLDEHKYHIGVSCKCVCAYNRQTKKARTCNTSEKRITIFGYDSLVSSNTFSDRFAITGTIIFMLFGGSPSS
jgi:hypothetical protein